MRPPSLDARGSSCERETREQRVDGQHVETYAVTKRCFIEPKRETANVLGQTYSGNQSIKESA